MSVPPDDYWSVAVIGRLAGFGKRIRRLQSLRFGFDRNGCRSVTTASIYILYRVRVRRRSAFAFRTQIRNTPAMKSPLDNIYFALTIR
jgi:hypothetical protein